MRHELCRYPHNGVMRVRVVVDMQCLDVSEFARMLCNDLENRPCVRYKRQFEHFSLLEEIDERSRVSPVALLTVDDEGQFKSDHVLNPGA